MTNPASKEPSADGVVGETDWHCMDCGTRGYGDYSAHRCALLDHDAAIDAICDVIGLTVLSYQEAIEGYLKLTGLAARLERLEKLYHDIGNTVLNLSEEFQDEGDRVYLGSTNDAEIFRQLGAKYWEWRLPPMRRDRRLCARGSRAGDGSA